VGDQTQVSAAFLLRKINTSQNPLNMRQIANRGPSRLFGKEENYFLYRETELDSSVVHTVEMSLSMINILFIFLLYDIFNDAAIYNITYWRCVLVGATLLRRIIRLLISNFRHILYVVCFLLGNSPASEFYVPTFRNTVPSS
jgi:hypothetical protein